VLFYCREKQSAPDSKIWSVLYHVTDSRRQSASRVFSFIRWKGCWDEAIFYIWCGWADIKTVRAYRNKHCSVARGLHNVSEIYKWNSTQYWQRQKNP